ncbi:MAG: HAD family hydrolase [Gemmatimonadota bacterium]
MTDAGAIATSVRTLLFDLDGTLIDSEGLILASYRHTMRRHRGVAPPDSEWLATLGTPLAIQLRQFAESESEAEAMLATYREHNERVHDALIREFPGVRQTLQWLHANGYRLGIVTSKLGDTVLRGLRACGLPREWFAALVTASDPVASKPDPAPVRLALRQLGGEPSGRTLFVGDSVWDLRAGRAAGTFTAAALWGPFSRETLAAERPDCFLRRMEELPTLLGAPRPVPGRSG